MKLLDLPRVSRVSKSILLCAGLMISSTAFSAAREVSVYLTSKRFGQGETIKADSGSRKITPATEYKYELTGKVRGQSGKPISQIIKGQMDIAAFVELVSPGGSSFLTGTYANPGGTLETELTVMNKTFAGTKKIKDVGTVKFSFVVVGKILTDGTCVMEVNDVKISSKPKMKLGSVIFTKGAQLKVSTVP
jgi:hypothetical protein